MFLFTEYFSASKTIFFLIQALLLPFASYLVQSHHLKGLLYHQRKFSTLLSCGSQAQLSKTRKGHSQCQLTEQQLQYRGMIDKLLHWIDAPNNPLFCDDSDGTVDAEARMRHSSPKAH